MIHCIHLGKLLQPNIQSCMFFCLAGFDLWAVRIGINYKYMPLVAAIIAMKNVTETAYAKIYSATGIELIICFSIYMLNFASRKKLYNGKYWKYAMLFALRLLPYFLLQRILSQSERIMIELIVGKVKRVYGFVNSIGRILSIVVTSIDGAMTL